jgi:8-oxo-dGTP pyrophosphatase MutT (NUDIX family)
MAYYYKIGLLVLNQNGTEFLVCEKAPEDTTSDYIMPGGQFEETTVEACLRNEIEEELHCQVDFDTLAFVGKYSDVAAGRPDRDIEMEVYRGSLIGEPVPSREIKFIHWIGKDAVHNPRVSPIIRNKIIPDLVAKGILK